jgi:Ca2+-binding RTX toxin-like protein
VDALTRVAQNDDFWGEGTGSIESALSFRATEGTTYSIRVAAFCCGETGSATLRWFPGAIIRGGSGDNVINGTAGRDYITGGGGADTIHGRGGADIVVGGGGRDQLYGDEGNDLLISRDFVRRNDVIYGGSGTDTARKDRGDRVFGVP